MNADVIIGMAAGTSVLKAVAFTLEGDKTNVARHCHSDMDPVPPKVRLAGGAAQAAMIMAMLQGIDTTMEDCTADWATPLPAAAKVPDPEPVGICEKFYPLHVRTREAPAPVWSAQSAVKPRADR